MGPLIVLRRAKASDAEFAYRVLEQSMKTYAIEAFGEWKEHEARARQRHDAEHEDAMVIEADGLAVGWLKVDLHPTHHQLEQLFLLPSHQGKGTGSEVLQTVMDQARRAGLPVRLRVLRVNPARHFYERHGFRVTAETPERYLMEFGLQEPN